MIGLYFGSFNPIHISHLVIAEYMLQYEGLDEVWFIVSPHNPLKEKSTLINPQQRLQMVKLAIAGNKKFKASDVEFRLPQPSYSIQTLTALQKKYPGKKFAIIMGSDNLISIEKWKDYESILKKFPILVYKRSRVNELKWKKYPQIEFIEAPMLDTSSTQIRNMIAENKLVRYLLRDEVWEYIKRNRLYRKSEVASP